MCQLNTVICSIRDSSQQCYPSPVKAPPRAAKYSYESPVKASHGQQNHKKREEGKGLPPKHGGPQRERGGGGGGGGNGKGRRMQLFKEGPAKEELASKSRDGGGDFDMKQLNSAQVSKLEERFNLVSPMSRDLKMTTETGEARGKPKGTISL